MNALRICHFGGWRGNSWKLPDADLYICTGNMFPNFYRKTGDRRLLRREEAIYYQARWQRTAGDYRQLLADPQASLFLVRGHLDLVHPKTLFSGVVRELGPHPQLSLWENFRISGFCGSRHAHPGWFGGQDMEELLARTAALPEHTDILVTHAPPVGLLSLVQRDDQTRLDTQIGLPGVLDEVERRRRDRIAAGAHPVRLLCCGYDDQVVCTETIGGKDDSLTVSLIEGGWRTFLAEPGGGWWFEGEHFFSSQGARWCAL